MHSAGGHLCSYQLIVVLISQFHCWTTTPFVMILIVTADNDDVGCSGSRWDRNRDRNTDELWAFFE